MGGEKVQGVYDEGEGGGKGRVVLRGASILNFVLYQFQNLTNMKDRGSGDGRGEGVG